MATITTTRRFSTFTFSDKPSYRSDKVRIVGMEDYKAAARTLAEAFFDDDVAFYFLDVPDNGGKTREELWPLHLEILEYIVCAHIYNGLVLSIGENHEGVALWYVALSIIQSLFRCSASTHAHTVQRSGHSALCTCTSSSGPTQQCMVPGRYVCASG